MLKGLCGACILEDALACSEDTTGSRQLVVHMPLGHTPSTSVFLVRGEEACGPFLRLKTWHRPAPPEFLNRFHRLQDDLASWGTESIDRPIAVRIDKNHCPSVLSEFRQGVTILERVRFGRLDPKAAIELLEPLIALVKQAHVRGLAHGSIVPGNVIVDAVDGQARLLDFGLTPLMMSQQDWETLASDDLAAFAALMQSVRRASLGSSSTGRVAPSRSSGL